VDDRSQEQRRRKRGDGWRQVNCSGGECGVGEGGEDGLILMLDSRLSLSGWNDVPTVRYPSSCPVVLRFVSDASEFSESWWR